MAKPLDLRILLVQAGGTDWDREQRLMGSANLPLRADEHDRLEGTLAALPELVGTPLPSVILSSKNESSIQTAALVASSLGGVKTREIEALGDVDLGLWEGVCGEDLEGRCPSTYRQWLEDPGSVTAPKGEAMGAAEARILDVVARAADKTKDEHPTIGVVLRGMAYALFRCWTESLPTGQMWNVLQDGPNEPRMLVIERARFERAKQGAGAG